MTHVLLCRHGQTDENARGIVQGHLPTSLNEVGRRQAGMLAVRLAGYVPRVTRVITSPLKRAVETAEIICGGLELPAIRDDRWMERHFGSGQGKPFDLLRIMTEGKLAHVDPEDAEPRDAFDARVGEALGNIPADGVTAIVTHGGVIGSVTRQIMEGAILCRNPPAQRPAVPNCSILHLWRETSSHPWVLECIAEASHITDVTLKDAG